MSIHVKYLQLSINRSLYFQGRVVGINLKEWSTLSEAVWYCFGTLIGESITRDRQNSRFQRALALR